MKPKNKLPDFKSKKEEAEFWDTHDVTDYIKDTRLNVSYEPKRENKETMTIRLSPSLRKRIDRIANEYEISTSSLIRMWIIDKIKTVD